MYPQPMLRPALRLSLDMSFRFRRKFASRAKNSEYNHLLGEVQSVHLSKQRAMNLTVYHHQQLPIHWASSSQAVGKLDNAKHSHLLACLPRLQGHAHDLISSTSSDATKSGCCNRMKHTNPVDGRGLHLPR